MDFTILDWMDWIYFMDLDFMDLDFMDWTDSMDFKKKNNLDGCAERCIWWMDGMDGQFGPFLHNPANHSFISFICSYFHALNGFVSTNCLQPSIWFQNWIWNAQKFQDTEIKSSELIFNQWVWSKWTVFAYYYETSIFVYEIKKHF